jgi:putative ABC transport system ATP-binding protein
MEKSLLRYIWKYTRSQQLWIVIIVAVSMIPYFLSLNLPIRIVNGPIQGEGFERPGATQNFLPIDFDLPLIGHVDIFEGFPLDRFWTLMALSFVFLLLVVINGLFKLYINTYKGRLGERMLRRIRFDLFDRMVRFPPSAFKRMKASEAATMVKDEVEPLGGFIGDAFVLPSMLGGQAATAMIFILVQNFWLGIIAAGIVLVQGIFIPKMRKRLIRLGRQRQLTARELAGRVGEVFDGINVVRTNDTSNYERADISHRLGRIFKIRYDLYQWKFLVK